MAVAIRRPVAGVWGPESTSVNVLDYGAVGNGVANDRASIQAAIDALPALGGVVFLPPGTYLVSSSLSVAKNVKLVGCGYNSFSSGATTISFGSVADALVDVTADIAFGADSIIFQGGGVASQRLAEFSAAVQANGIFTLENVSAWNWEKIAVVDASAFVQASFVNSRLQCANLSGARHWDGPGYIDCVATYLLGASAVDPRGGFANANNNLTVFMLGGQLEVREADCSSVELVNVACYFSDESSPITPTSARNRLVSCRFRNRSGGSATRYIDLPDAADNTTIVGCFFTGASSEEVRLAASSCVISNNINCKVLETGAADSNRYEGITSTSTIIGAASTIGLSGKWNILTGGGITSSANYRFSHGTSALATDATEGFFHVQSCAGPPTGTPATIPTGQKPMVYDSTNNKLYIYSGGWKKGQVAGVDVILG